MNQDELRELMRSQIELARRLMRNWPDWKRNILVRSAQPTVRVPRQQVDNRADAADAQHAS